MYKAIFISALSTMRDGKTVADLINEELAKCQLADASVVCENLDDRGFGQALLLVKTQPVDVKNK